MLELQISIANQDFKSSNLKNYKNSVSQKDNSTKGEIWEILKTKVQ